MQTYSSGLWQIDLPPDWQPAEAPTDPAETAFESDDGTKGILIGAWRLGEARERTPRDVAATFRANHLAGLVAMGGQAWETLVDEIVDLGPLSIVMSDAWARDQSYRIVSVVLARPPVVVRAVFHDYLCEDIDRSRAYFAAIVESLQLVEST